MIESTQCGEKNNWLIDTPPFTTSGARLHSHDMGVVDIGFCLLSLRGAGSVAERIHGRNVHSSPTGKHDTFGALSGYFRGIFCVGMFVL